MPRYLFDSKHFPTPTNLFCNLMVRNTWLAHPCREKHETASRPLSFFYVLGTYLFNNFFCVRWMCGLMGALATMEVLMLKHGRMLPPYVECEFKRAYNVYRSALNSLADRAIARREARYHIRPKLHFLGHLVYHYLPRNPRYFMNYADEDFVARTKRIAERSHPAHMSRLTLLRYTLHLSLRYSGKIAV